MLAKSSRLNLKFDFKRVATGKAVEGKYLKLFIKHSSQINSPKIGIAIRSKSFGKAHDRNRAKRLASYAFETIYSSLPKDVEIVALPKASIVEVKSEAVVRDLNEILNNQTN